MLILEPGEKIIYEVRRHMLLFYTKLTGTAIALLILPVIFHIGVTLLVPAVSNEFWMISLFAYSLILLSAWIYAFVAWTDYFLDTWIVTDKRVVDFEMRGLFSRDIATVLLTNIEDVKIVIDGFIHTFLKIGDIHIQTAGSDKEFVFRNVRDPEGSKAAIMQAMGAVVPDLEG